MGRHQERRDKQGILQFLREEGIGSLDDLADRLLAESEGSGVAPEEILRGRPTDAPVAPDIPFPKKPAKGRALHHRVELPVLVDDRREIDPRGGLSEFEDTPLDFVWDDEGEKQRRLRAFTSPAAARDYMRAARVRDEPPQDDPRIAGFDDSPSFHAGGAAAVFCEHVNFGGASRGLDLGHVLTNLTREHMWGILWWWTSWNDQISSVRGGSGWVTLWEHVYPPTYGYPPGSRLHVGPFRSVSSLVPLGWNDRVSAVNHHFFPE